MKPLTLALSSCCFLTLAALAPPPPSAELQREEVERVPVVVEHHGDQSLLVGLFATLDVWHDAGAFVVGAAEPAQLRGLQSRGITAQALVGVGPEDALALVDLTRGDGSREAVGSGRVVYQHGDLVLLVLPSEIEGVARTQVPRGVGHDGPVLIPQRPIARSAPPSWRGIPLGVNGPAPGAADPRIQALVNQVDAARVEASVAMLASNHSRNSTVPAYIDAARDQIIAQLQGYGLSPTTHTYSSSHGDNVLVEITGTVSPNRFVVVGAHYDSYAGPSSVPAPGADDNASGSAAVLELARLLATAGPFENSLRLIWFSGEEYGLHGSTADALASRAAGQEILGMLNTDMNAYRAAGDTLDVDFVTNNTSPALTSFCDTIGATYVANWASQFGALSGGSSDHASYNAQGFPAVFFFEDLGQYSPLIHSAADAYPSGTPDFGLSLMITRGVLAAAATLLEPLDMQIAHTPLPDTLDAAGPYPVTAVVTSLTGDVVERVELFFSGDGGQSYSKLPMAGSGPNYQGWIPSFGSPQTIQYYLRAVDDQDAREVDPPGAELGAPPHSFFVGTRNVIYTTDFEGPGDAGWTHAVVATQDDWQRGTPAGKSGDPSGAWSGTSAWGNDLGGPGWNGAYQNNVQNYLRSPSIDCSAASNVTLEFRRWLTVESGQYDQAQVRVNGAVVWQNPFGVDLVDGSWVPFSLDVSSQAAGQPSVQVELRLISDAGLVFGGWNIDDFALLELGPGTPGCPSAVTYCTAKVNSLGCTPAVATSGSPSASSSSPFLINASQVLNNKSGILFYGHEPGSSPFSGGIKCVRSPIRRTPLQDSGGNPPPNDCSGLYSFDFNGRIQSGVDPSLTVGRTVYAQYWSRDPASPSTTGLTDAVLFQICP